MNRKRYDEDFKKKLVKIYTQGNHTYRSLAKEYGVSAPTIRTWVLRYNKSNSFNLDANRTAKEKELFELRKKVRQLEMENDLLKQAALLSKKK